MSNCKLLDGNNVLGRMKAMLGTMVDRLISWYGERSAHNG
jgi:hypothetical protein